jgi:hypothetical protein
MCHMAAQIITDFNPCNPRNLCSSAPNAGGEPDLTLVGTLIQRTSGPGQRISGPGSNASLDPGLMLGGTLT